MSELKNKFGNNISWFLQDIADQINCAIEESDDIESKFEIFGGAEEGIETSCDVELVEILEAASSKIAEQDKVIGELKEQRKAFELHLGGLLTALKVKQGLTRHEALCSAESIRRILDKHIQSKGDL